MAAARGISVPFRFDLTGYPAPVSDAKIINDSIYTILSTYVGERVHRPTFGSTLLDFVFEPISVATIYRIKAEVRRAVAAWESRAAIVSVDVTNPSEGTLKIIVSWRANGSLQGVTELVYNNGTGA